MENFPSSVLELTNYPANQPTKLGTFCWHQAHWWCRAEQGLAAAVHSGGIVLYLLNKRLIIEVVDYIAQ